MYLPLRLTLGSVPSANLKRIFEKEIRERNEENRTTEEKERYVLICKWRGFFCHGNPSLKVCISIVSVAYVVRNDRCVNSRTYSGTGLAYSP